MIAMLIEMQGEVTREDVRNMILRFCVIDPDYDGDESYEAGNHLIAFYTALFGVSDEETILEDTDAEAWIMEHFTKAYASKMNRGLNARKIDRVFTREEALEAFHTNDTFCAATRMPAELATKLGLCMGEQHASRSLSMHDYFVANRD
jgi:hypothetical protein